MKNLLEYGGVVMRGGRLTPWCPRGGRTPGYAKRLLQILPARKTEDERMAAMEMDRYEAVRWLMLEQDGYDQFCTDIREDEVWDDVDNPDDPNDPFTQWKDPKNGIWYDLEPAPVPFEDWAKNADLDADEEVSTEMGGLADWIGVSETEFLPEEPPEWVLEQRHSREQAALQALNAVEAAASIVIAEDETDANLDNEPEELNPDRPLPEAPWHTKLAVTPPSRNIRNTGATIDMEGDEDEEDVDEDDDFLLAL